MFDLRGSTPRGVYLAVLPLFALLFYQALTAPPEKRRVWHWAGVGLLYGLMANLHPVTALAVGFVSTGLLALAVLRREARLPELGTYIALGALGALPMLWTFLAGTEGAYSGPLPFTFDEYFTIGLERIQQVWPYETTVSVFNSGLLPISALTAVPVITVGLVLGTLVIGGAHLLYRWQEQPTPTWVWVIAVAVPMTALIFLLRTSHIYLLSLTYLLGVLAHGHTFDKLDRRLLEVLVLLLLVLPITLLGQWIWRTFEIFELSLWVTQLPRGMRLLALPLFIWSARLALEWWQRRDWPLLIGMIGVLVWPRSDLVFSLVLGALLLAVWLWRPRLETRPEWLNTLVSAAAVGVIVGRTAEHWLLPGELGWATLTALAAGVMACAVLLLLERTETPAPAKAGAALIIGLAATLVVPRPDAPAYIAAPGELRDIAVYEAARLTDPQWFVEQDMGDIGLYEWARTTPVDSLFFTNSFPFRMYAQRSITHSWKDVGNAFFIRYPVVETYERYQALQAAYQQPDTLAEAVAQVGADYVVFPAGRPTESIPTGWEMAFSNERWKVYAVR